MRTLLALLVALLGASLLPGTAHAADEQKGREVYERHCLACHGIDGVSLDPMIPNFADGDALYRMDAELIQRISDGKDTMPAFRGLLSSEEMRNVIAYIRTF